jgi:hypothetical protein
MDLARPGEAPIDAQWERMPYILLTECQPLGEFRDRQGLPLQGGTEVRQS